MDDDFPHDANPGDAINRLVQYEQEGMDQSYNGPSFIQIRRVANGFLIETSDPEGDGSFRQMVATRVYPAVNIVVNKMLG